MSLGPQVQAFAARVVQARAEWFPCEVLFRGVKFTATCSGFRDSKKLQEVGLVYTHDAIARLPVTSVAVSQPPRNGEQIICFVPGSGADGQKARITEVRPHANNPEWRVGLSRV